MNSNKWRTLKIPTETLRDLIASHLYAMRGMDRREIVEISLPEIFSESIPIKIKMKEVKPIDQIGKKKNAEMAKITQEEN